MRSINASKCKSCGVMVVWVPKTGGWHRPVEQVTETGFLQIDASHQLREATGLYRVHACDPAAVEAYATAHAAEQARTKAWAEAIESIDCPHSRCNGVAGGKCKSLVDGVTDLRSYHDERRREALRRGLFDNLPGV